MSETLFNLLFATAGMVAVFTVITILTLWMILTGRIFSRPKRRDRTGTATPPSRRDDSVPEDHVAVIAAAVAIHTGDLGPEVSLIEGDMKASWAAAGRGLPGPGEVPALRRTK